MKMPQPVGLQWCAHLIHSLKVRAKRVVGYGEAQVNMHALSSSLMLRCMYP